jgi:ABC-type antimicrobial peptide transport system permease subunit
MTLAILGTALGLVAALASNQLLTAMTFDVSATDAATLALAAAVLLAVAALASIIPARSSTRIDPLVALQTE